MVPLESSKAFINVLYSKCYRLHHTSWLKNKTLILHTCEKS
jgi:hypothetical protein